MTANVTVTNCKATNIRNVGIWINALGNQYLNNNTIITGPARGGGYRKCILAGAWYHRPEAALTGNIEISNNIGTTGGHNDDNGIIIEDELGYNRTGIIHVRDNSITYNADCGTGFSSGIVFLTNVWNAVVENNTIDFAGHVAGAGIVLTPDFYAADTQENNVFSGNILKNMQNARIGAVFVDSTNAGSARNYSFINNDYKESGLPGWNTGVGCVYLGTGSTDNLVKESGNFPPGTGGASKQVADFGTNNRVIGHPANHVSDPSIGQRMKDLRALFAQMDMLQEDEQ